MKAAAASFALALAFAGTAAAQTPVPSQVQTAIDHKDLPGLRAAGAAAAGPDKELAAAVELGWLHQDAAASKALTALAAKEKTPSRKAAALSQLSSVQMRLGQFKAAAKSGRDAAALSGKPADAGELQTFAFLDGISGEKPTKAVGAVSGRVPVKRDFAKLPRADLEINGVTQDAILDTGANFSTVTESTAKKLKLRPLKAAVSVGSTVSTKVASKLAVADKLKVGDAEFTDVIFIVLPDEALTLLGGKYTIEAILGMPVFLEMGRIEISKQGDAEWFTFGRSGAKLSGDPNLIFTGMNVLALADVDSRPVKLLLDSGANTSSFNALFATEFADRMKAAEASTGGIGGAGGVNYDVKQKRISNLPLSVGGRTATLSSIAVSDDASDDDRHGSLGNDVLGIGFVIDFDAARLDLKPPS